MPGVMQFDLALEKRFVVKERYQFQFRVDAFNVFNHANWNGSLASSQTTLNFNAYPTGPGGVVTGLPSIANNATAFNSAGAIANLTAFGTLSNPAAGSPGGPRVLQLMARFSF
jgi:hypothetical protein